MKKPNRRSKQKSGSDASSSPSVVCGDNGNLDKRIGDLRLQNEALKREIEELRCKLGDVTPTSCVGVQKLKVVELKKLATHSPFSAPKPKLDEASKQFQDEVQRLKVQNVQLQCKMKLDSMQFRLIKASLEKEVLQLKKEQRRNKYEVLLLSTQNQRQKHVLQRKTKETFLAKKRLKELIETRKASSGKTVGAGNGSKTGTQGIEHDFEVKMKLDEVSSKYELQIEKMADEIKKLKLELEMLREEKSRPQDDEDAADINDSELIDLREQVVKLSCMVSQMNMSKAQPIQAEKSPVDLVQTSVSIGSNIHSPETHTSELECSQENIATTEKSFGVCCSCSRKSLCKTQKCECRASGSSCGMSCGCASAKCTNREKVTYQLDDMPVKDMVPGNIEEEGTVQNAMPIQNKVVEEFPEKNGDRGLRKQPLREIGNIQINTVAGKHGHKKKGQKAIIQPDDIDPPFSILEDTKVPRRNKNSAPLFKRRSISQQPIGKLSFKSWWCFEPLLLSCETFYEHVILGNKATEGLNSKSDNDSILQDLDEIEVGESVFRNVQVMTHFLLWCRDAIDKICSSIIQLQVELEKLKNLAINNEGLIIPGYTHLQRSQPVLLQHHLQAYVEQLDDGRRRLLDCRVRLNVTLLGARTLAGWLSVYLLGARALAVTGLPIDALGFDAPRRNSNVAVSDRHVVLEFLSAKSTIATHLSRLGEEWGLWTSEGFGFITSSDSVSTGIPFAYNRGLQEEKELTFDGVMTIIAKLEVSAGFAQTISFDKERIKNALLAAYDDAKTLAKYLGEKGIPLETSHDIVEQTVALCVAKNCQLVELTLDEFRSLNSVFDGDVYEFLGVENTIKKFSSYGSTGSACVADHL